jgi:hypothetical protein
MSFFSENPHPNSEATKMSLGQMINLMSGDDPELRVPDYQREYVWSRNQQERYLESLSRNMPIFGAVINLDTRTGIQWIMDGQNRIETIRRFLNDEIRYKGVCFSELPDNEKRKIKNMKMSYTETRDWSREQCQDFFMRIQEGVKLKDGELIHARSDNELTRAIVHILSDHRELFLNKPSECGIGLSKTDILRYGHYELIGTVIHMVRTKEYPVRPGKTALKECCVWDDEHTPTRSQREISISETEELLEKYSQLVSNVARLKDGIKKPDHLRLLYFFYKSELYKRVLDDNIYNRIDSLLNQVLNKDNPIFSEIKALSGYNEEGIYNKYVAVYNM